MGKPKERSVCYDQTTWNTYIVHVVQRKRSDLIVTLGKLVDNKDYSEEMKDGSLSWETRSRLVQSDPVTCVRHFDNRVSQFIQIILKSESSQLGKLSDFFYRVEFQQRGSPHIHMLAWIQDAPKYGKSDESGCLEIY